MTTDANTSRPESPSPESPHSAHSTAADPDPPQSGPWSYVAERALVARIIASPSFARSERLSALLTYLTTMSLKGRGRELSEQRIGQMVFGRKPNYDSSADGIVRTQVSRLRQRLEQYFAAEGRHEPIRVQIPRGGYVTLFERIGPEPDTTTDPPRAETLLSAAAPASKERPLSLRRFLPWSLVFLLALALLLSLYGRGKSRTEATGATGAESGNAPLAHAFWNQILHPGTETLVVPADSGLMLYYRFHPAPLTLDAYLMGQYRTPKPDGPNSMVNLLHASMPVEFANRRYTSIVDLEVGSALAARAALRHVPLTIRYARDLRPNDLKEGNIVLIGASEANPWVQLFERNMNFVLQNHREQGIFSVLNRSPLASEPKSWDSIATDPMHHVYGIIALRPNLTGTGNVLIVEGTSMAGTEAAWDFLADKNLLNSFLAKIRSPKGSVPHFEVVVESQNTSSSSGTDHILAWRVE